MQITECYSEIMHSGSAAQNQCSDSLEYTSLVSRFKTPADCTSHWAWMEATIFDARTFCDAYGQQAIARERDVSAFSVGDLQARVLISGRSAPWLDIARGERSAAAPKSRTNETTRMSTPISVKLDLHLGWHECIVVRAASTHKQS